MFRRFDLRAARVFYYCHDTILFCRICGSLQELNFTSIVIFQVGELLYTIEERKGGYIDKGEKIRDETISNWNAPSGGQLSITHSFITETHFRPSIYVFIPLARRRKSCEKTNPIFSL
jgi:hypothetical protein